MTQKKGVVPNLIRQVGVDINQLKREVHALIDKLPKSNGSGKARTSGTFDQVIQQAKSISKKNWETLISPVRILFVGIEQVNDNARTLISDVGLTKDRMMQALEIMRRGKKVEGEDSESNYESF